MKHYQDQTISREGNGHRIVARYFLVLLTVHWKYIVVIHKHSLLFKNHLRNSSFQLPSVKWHKVTLFTRSWLCAARLWKF